MANPVVDVLRALAFLATDGEYPAVRSDLTTAGGELLAPAADLRDPRFDPGFVARYNELSAAIRAPRLAPAPGAVPRGRTTADVFAERAELAREVERAANLQGFTTGLGARRK